MTGSIWGQIIILNTKFNYAANNKIGHEYDFERELCPRRYIRAY